MALKFVATDFDGTFVDSKGQFDEGRFIHILDELEKRGVHFVCASGDQYYLLEKRLMNVKNRISFVADNGAFVKDQNELIYTANVDKNAIFKALECINKLDGVSVLVCCKKAAYGLKTMTDKEYAWMKQYYERIILVDKYEDIDDTFFKLNMEFAKEKSDEFYTKLKSQLDDILDVVTGSIGSININGKGINKAKGLKRIMDRYGIQPEECIAFGDGHNDIEMLKMVKYGYVMGNAQKDMLERFSLHAPSNDEQGVLCVLEKALENGLFDE